MGSYISEFSRNVSSFEQPLPPPPSPSLPSTPRFTTVQIEVIPIPNMDRGHPNFGLISPSSPPYGFAIFFDLSAKFC